MEDTVSVIMEDTVSVIMEDTVSVIMEDTVSVMANPCFMPNTQSSALTRNYSI